MSLDILDLYIKFCNSYNLKANWNDLNLFKKIYKGKVTING